MQQQSQPFNPMPFKKSVNKMASKAKKVTKKK